MNRLLFLIVILYTNCSYAQSIDTKSNKGFIALYVADVVSLSEWYARNLGFKILQSKKVNDQLGFAMVDGYGTWIEMIQHPQTIKRTDLSKNFNDISRVEGFVKLGLRVEGVDSLYNVFKSRGVKVRYEPLTNPNFSMRLFIVEDPEGNWVQFYDFEK